MQCKNMTASSHEISQDLMTDHVNENDSYTAAIRMSSWHHEYKPCFNPSFNAGNNGMIAKMRLPILVNFSNNFGSN